MSSGAYLGTRKRIAGEVVGEKEGGAESLTLRGGGNSDASNETLRDLENEGQSMNQSGEEDQVATVAPVRDHF